jgi:hypothetical protein
VSHVDSDESTGDLFDGVPVGSETVDAG